MINDMPADWTVVEWTAAGGYSSTAAEETQGKRNRHRERIWFSKYCINPEVSRFPLFEPQRQKQAGLFDDPEPATA